MLEPRLFCSIPNKEKKGFFKNYALLSMWEDLLNFLNEYEFLKIF